MTIHEIAQQMLNNVTEVVSGLTPPPEDLEATYLDFPENSTKFYLCFWMGGRTYAQVSFSILEEGLYYVGPDDEEVVVPFSQLESVQQIKAVTFDATRAFLDWFDAYKHEMADRKKELLSAFA